MYMRKQNQAAFIKMVNHLRKQNAKSMKDGSMFCQYRGENGTSCAVGCLIDDEHYDTNIEQQSAESERVIEALEASGWDDISGDLLMAVQTIHDDHEVEQWEGELKLISKIYNLDLPPLGDTK